MCNCILIILQMHNMILRFCASAQKGGGQERVPREGPPVAHASALDAPAIALASSPD